MTIKKGGDNNGSTHEPSAATTLFAGPMTIPSGDADVSNRGGGGISASSSQVSDDDEVIEVVAGDNGTTTTTASSISSTASSSNPTSTAKPGFSRMPSNKGSRFAGGLAGIVEASVASSMEQNLGNWTAPFTVTAKDLGELSQEPSRAALADLLYKGVINMTEAEVLDEETPSPTKKLQQDVLKLTKEIKAAEEAKIGDPKAVAEAEKNADMAANVLTSVLLRSSPESGIDPREVEHRKEVFGSNALTPKKLDSFLKLCFEAVQDFVLIMLIVLGCISIVIEVTTVLGHGEKCTTCWIEGAAILVSVIIVVMVTAGIDYAKQFAFLRLTKSLHDTNTKAVIRDGLQVTVIDDDIVVGDILSVNAHNLASIPADCVLLGPAGAELHMDESTLTGESKAIKKRPGDIVLSGTHAIQGSAKMVVIAVGVNSVAGKIRARVYETDDHESDLDDDGGENSPLFVKLDIIAKRIGIAGTVAACISFLASLIIGLGIQKDPPKDIIGYLVTAITVLAVAVPEGLPLAVTLALAFSSNKMTKEQNLVKHLDACETMGCATTICTDKTGTLTANKMSCRALYAGGENYLVEDPAESLGGYIKRLGAQDELVELICRCIAIDTMNETVLYYASDGTTVDGSSGNPTEVALLHLVHEFGSDFAEIRNTTKGRSDQGMLGMHLGMGKHIEFTSARKIMSWAVPMDDGSYRLYCKGAQEVVVARCSTFVSRTGDGSTLTDESREDVSSVALAYSRRGMRCLGLAYRDLPADFDWESTSSTIMNSDGTNALLAETEMTLLALVGIEDPLRHEVPGAIEKCYAAGIDVRMVTGDNPNTAVSIAYQAGIIRDFHFKEGTTERVATNLKDNVLMEGKTFRSKVYRVDEEGKKEFDQVAFDKIWPRLRVLARSSPDDKLTLAHGLNQSNLFADKDFCQRILETEGIKIFPDRQVVAMTGDGTNDAPALKRADIGFAMGVAGTQIAKDAADIILLDDNFASIVTAAKWGRNVYASIQKFLQFQLTVNIAAVITALVGSLTYQKSPLAAIQLLWVNLLMDSLASVALASEPPTEALLQRPPVNRTDSMITKRMLANMLGQATYQIAVVMILLFAGPTLFDIPPGDQYEKSTGGDNSLHYTIIFNSFVWMQLFNEINSRKLKGEFNVFEGVLTNPYFCGIWVVTSCLQALIVQYGSIAFHVYEGGLPAEYWGISMALGLGSLPVQQLINFIYKLSKKYKGYRINKRVKRNARQATQQVEAGGLSSERPAGGKEKPVDKREKQE